jgi:hypothetical protein
MKHRPELLSIYRSFARMIHNHFYATIKNFHSDFGGGYLSDAF